MVEKATEKLYNLLGGNINEIFGEKNIKATKNNLSESNENYSDGFEVRRRYDVISE